MTCCSGRPGASGAKMTCNNLLTSGSVMPVSVFSPQPPLLQHQEPKSQHRQGHVMVPTAPATHLVIIQAHFLLAAQEAVLDGPAVMSCLHPLQQRAIWSGVAQVVLDVWRLITTAFDHQPQFRPQQIIALRHEANPGEMSLLRALGALPKTQALPGAGRQRLRDLLHGLRLGLARGYPRFAARSACSTRLGFN